LDWSSRVLLNPELRSRQRILTFLIGLIPFLCKVGTAIVLCCVVKIVSYSDKMENNPNNGISEGGMQRESDFGIPAASEG
jgi:hypothetical protein